MRGKDTQRYIQLILKRLTERYGANLETQLTHRNMADLFVAVLLSPQSTDKQTNNVTKGLFKRYRSFEDYANSDLRTLRHYLRGMNYYKTKARHLKQSARMILKNFHGKVPKTLDELMTLPGVGRKVGNVVLNEGYGIDEGIAVDTHCGRVAHRIGLSRHTDPEKIEIDLLTKVPKKDWNRTSNLFIELGRDTCSARNRRCESCVLKDICPSSLAS